MALQTLHAKCLELIEGDYILYSIHANLPDVCREALHDVCLRKVNWPSSLYLSMLSIKLWAK